MVGVSELMGEKEIIFPEMAALTIGMWIVDKKVWTVSRLKLVLLMSIGAIVGVCIVRYSPFPLIVTYVGYRSYYANKKEKRCRTLVNKIRHIVRSFSVKPQRSTNATASR